MQALVYDGGLRLGRFPRPRLAPGKVLVRMSRCAISRWDMDIVRALHPIRVRPIILGHEFVGRVEAVGEEVDEQWMGQRVICRPYADCGRCGPCRDGKTWLCSGNRESTLGMGMVDGAMAEILTVSEGSLLPVPGSVDDEEAVFAYPVASCLSALEHIIGEPPQRVLVVGDGNIGLLMTWILHWAGHSISVFGKHPSRKDLLWKSGIAFTGIHESAEIERTFSDNAFSRESFDFVFECSGRISGFELASMAVRPGGRIILLSHHTGQAGGDLSVLIDRQVEIFGVDSGDLQEALEFLSKHRIDVLPLVGGRYSLTQGVTAFEMASQRGSLKAIVENQRRDDREDRR